MCLLLPLKKRKEHNFNEQLTQIKFTVSSKCFCYVNGIAANKITLFVAEVVEPVL